MTRMRRQQHGIVAVMVILAMLVLVFMAALAIDPGRLLISKSTLQSAVDAAALAAAKIVDAPAADTVVARETASQVFHQNIDRYTFFVDKTEPDITFSRTLNPFVPGSSPPEYVRVIATDYSIWATFSQALGISKFSARASAVAGRSAPIPEPCDLLPVAVCAVPGAPAPHYGYPTAGEGGHFVTPLKLASGAAGTTFGPGNFQLIRVGGMGASVIRENMAGGAVCAPPGGMMEIDPNPGNVVGPVAQGLNTRFGMYTGPMSGTSDRYPPDCVTTPAPSTPLAFDGTNLTYNGKVITSIGEIGYTYANYAADKTCVTGGKPERRIAAIPIVDCEHKVPGTSGTLPRLGYGCFFLLQPVVHGSGGDSWIFGEFVDECEASGSPGPTPGQGPYKIVLHDDPDSDDS